MSHGSEVAACEVVAAPTSAPKTSADIAAAESNARPQRALNCWVLVIGVLVIGVFASRIFGSRLLRSGVLAGRARRPRAVIVGNLLTCSPCSPSSLAAPLLALTSCSRLWHGSEAGGFEVSGRRRCTTLGGVSRVG